MIKCVTFDLDDTLWAVDPVVEQANRTLFDWLHSNAADFTRMFSLHDLPELRRQVLQAHPDISHSVTQIRLKLLEAGLTRAGYPPQRVRQLADDAFEVFLEARQQVDFFEHALALIDRLHKQGYQLGALSNGNADIHRVGLGEHFDFQFNADGVGSEKPDPLMFHQMLHHTGLRPEQVVHVGDDPVTDIKGAQNAGVWSIWVNLKGADWTGEAPADREVQCLSQIDAAIESIRQEAESRATL
ncbi:HAD family hydrolase [Marinobacterium arenosum]|uniref:HAD family hydrolase n=1 Tax=Marinobacterium arenosum TaxID=2862496 RepID=UPI001C95BF1E|nr:HAD-IA family hydrolase [Marinobacterium arenosum]MBY4676425.1 HAD-IA family hydrolase [Marinobacterium arenosum]